MLILSLFLACSAEPDPCDAMCEAASDAYGQCLDDWGADWPAAGYESRADFVQACQTWAWEQRELEDDAGLDGATDQTCAERTDMLSAADASCQTYTQIDWNTAPGEG